jgi:hypothetical protein
MSESSNGSAAPSSAAPAASSSPSSEANASANPVNSSTNQSPSNAAEIISPDAEAEIQEALENGDQKEAQRLIKKYQLKVRGKTVEKEIDLSDDEFIRNQLQLAEVSKQSMQESAEIRKAYQKELERFRQNPWQVLEELGLNPDDLAESRIKDRIEEMKKSPEQLELERRNRELEEARAEAKKLKEEKEAFEMQRLQEQAQVQLKDEIGKAISATKMLPHTPYVEKRIADSMLWAINNGFEDVTAEDVVALVEKEMRDEMAQLYDHLPEDMLEQYIGKKNIDRMRKRRVAQVKQTPSVNDIKQTALSAKAAEANKPREQKRVPAKDFFKNLGKQR